MPSELGLADESLACSEMEKSRTHNLVRLPVKLYLLTIGISGSLGSKGK